MKLSQLEFPDFYYIASASFGKGLFKNIGKPMWIDQRIWEMKLPGHPVKTGQARRGFLVPLKAGCP
jgi:hypothetical protein